MNANASSWARALPLSGLLALLFGFVSLDAATAQRPCPEAGSSRDARTLGCAPSFLTRNERPVPGANEPQFDRTFVVRIPRQPGEFRTLAGALQNTRAGGVVTISRRDGKIINGSNIPVVSRPLTILMDRRIIGEQPAWLEPDPEFANVPVLGLHAGQNGRCLVVDPIEGRGKVNLVGLKFIPSEGGALDRCIRIRGGDVALAGVIVDGDGRNISPDGSGSRREAVGIAVSGGITHFQGANVVQGVDIGVESRGGVVRLGTTGAGEIAARRGVVVQGGEVQMQTSPVNILASHVGVDVRSGRVNADRSVRIYKQAAGGGASPSLESACRGSVSRCQCVAADVSSGLRVSTPIPVRGQGLPAPGSIRGTDFLVDGFPLGVCAEGGVVELTRSNRIDGSMVGVLAQPGSNVTLSEAEIANSQMDGVVVNGAAFRMLNSRVVSSGRYGVSFGPRSLNARGLAGNAQLRANSIFSSGSEGLHFAEEAVGERLFRKREALVGFNANDVYCNQAGANIETRQLKRAQGVYGRNSPRAYRSKKCGAYGGPGRKGLRPGLALGLDGGDSGETTFVNRSICNHRCDGECVNGTCEVNYFDPAGRRQAFTYGQTDAQSSLPASVFNVCYANIQRNQSWASDDECLAGLIFDPEAR